MRGLIDIAGHVPHHRLRRDRTKALVHDLGGYPGEMLSFVSVLGSQLEP